VTLLFLVWEELLVGWLLDCPNVQFSNQ